MLREAGIYVANGMGPSPLSWQEIDAWLSRTKRELPTWAVLLIREMSEVYVSEVNQATEPTRPAPYTDVQYVDRQKVSDGLKSLFRGMMKKPNKD